MKNLNGPAGRAGGWWKRRAVEISGWLLIAAGVAALVLPGPGFLCLVAGLSLLSLRYMWARRLLRPVKARAFLLATKGVMTRPRIVVSVMGALALGGVGIIWGMGTAVPPWWPLADRWWLAGGWATGVTLISSGGFALSLIVYSYRRFRSPAPGETLPAVSN